MTLEEWIKLRGHGSKAWLARQTGLSWRAIHEAARGGCMRYANAVKVCEATDGAVTVAELCGGRS